MAINILDDLKLKAYLKTSGGKGYHINKQPEYNRIQT